MVDEKTIPTVILGGMRYGKTFYTLESAQLYANRTCKSVLLVVDGQATIIEPQIDSRAVSAPANGILRNARIEPLPHIPSDNFSEQAYFDMVAKSGKS